jgi:Transferase family
VDGESSSSSRYSIPLTISDVHLRNEQLPFCFYFAETLNEGELLRSLERTLQERFSMLGGSVRDAADNITIECNINQRTSIVPVAIGTINCSLDEWLLSSDTVALIQKSASGHAPLAPIFDCLFTTDATTAAAAITTDDASSSSSSLLQPLARIRITYFDSCGGTAIAVNMNHCLGDTASALRFVQSWGREMRQSDSRTVPVCNVRAHATATGMVTPDLAAWMCLPTSPPLSSERDGGFLAAFLGYYWPVSLTTKTVTAPTLINPTREDAIDPDVVNHEYVKLQFTPDVLEAMRAYGVEASQHDSAQFVSTNDMLSAFGWLLKRSLSGNDHFGVSMVINLRGKCGVDAFCDAAGSEAGAGVFGNGITNVVARHRPTKPCFDTDDVFAAALAIRRALIQGMEEMPERLFESRRGYPMQAPCSMSTFATTSWRQFPLWQNIRFKPTSKLVGFHGQPWFPLPKGETFSSVISPLQCGGSLYSLLLPSDKVLEAKQQHQQLCNAFLHWHPSTIPPK